MINNSLESGECTNQEVNLDDELICSEFNSKVDHLKERRSISPNRGMVVQAIPSQQGDLSQPRIDRKHFINELKISEHVSEHTKCNATKAKYSAKVDGIGIPQQRNMPIRVLSTPFNKSNAVLLTISSLAAAAANVQEAFNVVYTLFQSMAPDLTFQPHKKELRCRGYYTKYFDTCVFEAQIWRVHPSVAAGDQHVGEYVCELRRKTQEGRDPFDDLLRSVAVELQRAGYAKRYANGHDIYPDVSTPLDIDNFSTLSNDLGCSVDTYAITLDTDSVERLTSSLVQRIYPHYHETLRLLAKCSAGSIDNRELLMENSKLGGAVLWELNNRTQASTCYNALKLIEQAVVTSKGAFAAVARMLLVFSGLKPSGYKQMRSQAIENTALGAMKTLTLAMGEEEWKEARMTIERDLFGKLGEELYGKVQAICTRIVV